MSKEQFELYLSLVRKFLKLNSNQLTALSDELADHYESRREELISQGLTVTEAEKQAIDELGDATQLAHQLSTLKREQQRKWIMRTSITGLTCLCLVTVILGTMWAPQGTVSTPQMVTAQGEPNKVQSTGSAPLEGILEGPVSNLPPASGSGNPTVTNTIPGLSEPTLVEMQMKPKVVATKAEIEKKLNTPIEVVYTDTSVVDVIDHISNQLGIDIIIDKRSFEQVGMVLDEPVTISLKSKITVNEFIKILGNIVITDLRIKAENGYAILRYEEEPEMIIQVYDVADMINIAINNDPDINARSRSQPVGVIEGSDLNSLAYDPPPAKSSAKIEAANRLIEVIMNSSGGEWMDRDGTGATINEFDGRLIIRAVPNQHEKVTEVLELLRKNRPEEKMKEKTEMNKSV